MKDITFKHVKITNCKAFKQFETDLAKVTNIYADNEKGKTSILNLISWCLRGKDLQNRADYEIKPLDKNNNTTDKLDCEVELTVEVHDEDGTYQTKFTRIYKEVWADRRADGVEYLKGHTTDYKVDGVPINKEAEYKEYVTRIFGNDQLLQLIVQPGAFCDDKVKYTTRREILNEIAGGIENEDIIKVNPKFRELLESCGRKSVYDFLKERKADRKKIEDEQSEIEPSIKENLRLMPEPVEESKVQSKISSLESESEALSKQIDSIVERNKAHDQKVYDISKQINTLKESIETIKRQDRADFDKQSETANSQRRIALREAQERQDSIDSVLKKIATLEADRNELVQKKSKVSEDWKVEHARTLKLDDTDTKCPVCKSPYDESVVADRQQKMTENFNLSKAENLKLIESKGFKLAEDISVIADKIVVLKEELETKQSLSEIKIPDEAKFEYKQSNETITKIEKINGEIAELEKNKSDLESGEKESYENLREQRTEIQNKITTLKASLQVNIEIANRNNRIAELEKMDIEYAKSIAKAQRDINLVEDFIKTKMELVETNVSKYFEFVKWKMFEPNIGEGEKHIAEAIFNGVPFGSLNRGNKLIAGLDIIKTLQKHYGIKVGVLVDDRESVTTIQDMDCQMIQCWKIIGQEELRIDHSEINPKMKIEIL